ncbi:MAG TPA: hypothetical protein VKD67_10700 [Acidimicrobiales bacterium]|nr:hypothetical protein [Acidimicrobiales bacterium]
MVGAVVGVVVLVGITVVGPVVLVVGAVVGGVVLVVVVGGATAHVDSAPPSQLHRPSLQAEGMSFLTAFLHRRLGLPRKPAHSVLIMVAMAALHRWRLHRLTAAG